MFKMFKRKDKRVKALIEKIKDEFDISLEDSFLDTIDDPTPILRSMVMTSMNFDHSDFDCWKIGKQMQRTHKNKIPFKTEYEVSAGLWFLIFEDKV